MIYKDTHFGRALTELRPPLTVIITTYCLSKQECLDRSENIWWCHLNQMGHTNEYYEVIGREKETASVCRPAIISIDRWLFHVIEQNKKGLENGTGRAFRSFKYEFFE